MSKKIGDGGPEQRGDQSLKRIAPSHRAKPGKAKNKHKGAGKQRLGTKELTEIFQRVMPAFDAAELEGKSRPAVIGIPGQIRREDEKGK